MSSRNDLSRRQTLRERLRQSLYTGLAIIVPLLVTLLVVSFVWGFIFGTLQPVTTTAWDLLGVTGAVPEIVLEILTLLSLVAIIALIGFIGNSFSGADQLQDQFDQTIAKIPGIGSVYRIFDEMRTVVLDTNASSFREVKLVEFPSDGAFAIGFITAETPEIIEDETGHEEMLTLYVPLAPNPLMGGYVMHVSAERCVDIDMSVEEGVKTIISSGVAVGQEGSDAPDEISDRLPGVYEGNGELSTGGETESDSSKESES